MHPHHIPQSRCLIRARFLSLIQSKLRLCAANHRAGYFSNLACYWLRIVWTYSEHDSENGPWLALSNQGIYLYNKLYYLKKSQSLEAATWDLCFNLCYWFELWQAYWQHYCGCTCEMFQFNMFVYDKTPYQIDISPCAQCFHEWKQDMPILA